MSTLPWRILVVTDLGTDTREPVAVTVGTLDGWFESAGLAAAPSTLDPAGRLAAGVTGAALDAWLHDPARQRIEAAWRGLALVLAHAGDAVRIEVLSVPRAALVERFREAVHEPESTAAEPVSLVVLDFDFTHKAADLAALAALASMAAELQAPIVANAGAGFFDLRFLVQAVAVKDLPARLADAPHAGWQALQKHEDARWLCLTLNRFLLRAPWKLEAYAEACAESNPDSYLWGRGGWLVAAALARSVRAHGHALDLSGAGGRFDGLPTRPWPVKANETSALATEVPFPETQALELTHAAFTTLTGALDRPTVLMSMAVTAHRYGAARLTVEGTLGYQLTASRLALACGGVAGELPDGAGDDAVRAALAARLGAEFAGLLGEGGEGLTVEVLPAADGLPRRAAVALRPTVVIEGKSPKFDVEFGLEA